MVTFKRPWDVLDVPEGQSSYGRGPPSVTTTTTPTKPLQPSTPFISQSSQIPSSSAFKTPFQKPPLTRTPAAAYSSTTTASQLPLPPPELTTDVSQRLADYAWLSIILPLRNFVRSLILWRLGFRCLLWFLTQILPLLFFKWSYPSHIFSLLFSPPTSQSGFVSTIISSIRILSLETLVIGWSSLLFGSLLLLRTALIRYAPPPSPIITNRSFSFMSFPKIANSTPLLRISSNLKPSLMIIIHFIFATLTTAATTLAIRLIIPGAFTVIHAFILGIIETSQFFCGQHYILRLLPSSYDNISWNHPHNNENLKDRHLYLIASTSLFTLFLSFLFWSVALLLPSIGDILKFLTGIPFITQFPILIFATPSSSNLYSTSVSILIGLVLSFLTSMFFLARIEEHTNQLNELMNLNLLKSPDEILSLFNDNSYFSQMIIALKFSQYSRNPPHLPPHFTIQPTSTSSASSGSKTTMKWRPAISYMAQQPSATHTSLDQIEPIHLYFGVSYGPHRPLPHATLKSDNVLGPKPPTRIRPMPLSSTIPTDAPIRRILMPGQETVGKPKSRQVAKALSLVFRGGAFIVIRDQLLNRISRIIMRFLPSQVYRIIMVATHEQPDNISRLLLWDSQPLHRIGIETQFLESGSQTSCNIDGCICKKGLLVNRWIYETFFNERYGDAIWGYYSAQFLKVNEALATSIDLLRRLLNSRALSNGPLSQVPMFALTLETLSAANAVHSYLSSLVASPTSTEAVPPHVNSVWGALTPTSALSCAAAQVSSKPSKESEKSVAQPSDDPNTLRQRFPLERAPSTIVANVVQRGKIEMVMTSNHTCRLDEFVMRELIEDCYKSVRIIMELSYLYGKGFKQWLEVATTMKLSNRVNASIQKTLLSVVKLLEQVEHFTDDFDHWKEAEGNRPYLVTELIYQKLRQRLVFNLMNVHGEYLELLDVCKRQYLLAFSSSHLGTRIRNLSQRRQRSSSSHDSSP